MTSDAARAQRAAKGDVFELRLGRRRLAAGDVITVRGLRGEFRFCAARVVDGRCEWVQLFGGTADRQSWRYVTPERIGTKRRSPKILRVGE